MGEARQEKLTGRQNPVEIQGPLVRQEVVVERQGIQCVVIQVKEINVAGKRNISVETGETSNSDKRKQNSRETGNGGNAGSSREVESAR